MNMAYLMIPVALLAVSLLISFILVKKGKPAKKVMRVHFLTLILIVAATCAVPFMASAAANDPAAAEEVATAVTSVGDGMKYLAAALAVGLAGIGGGIAVASGASAVAPMAEDPKAFGKSIIFVALGEGFGLYGLLIAIMILILK